MIQGTVSLDHENADDCTVILPGLHKHIKEWDTVLTESGLSTAALVHRIDGNMFTAEDEKPFGTKWTPQPCQRGQVRVTLPHRGVWSGQTYPPHHAPLVLWPPE
jgi:hypothetical protein